MGPTGHLPVMMTNTTRHQDLTALRYMGRLPARVDRSISRMAGPDARQPSCSVRMRREGSRRISRDCRN